MLGTKANVFPVGEVVSGVFLRKVSYELTDKFEAVKFSFVRDGSWINLYVTNPPKIDDYDLYQKKKYRAALKLESVSSIFLEEEVMRECFREAESFRGFAESLIAQLELTNFRTIELDIKTLPGPKMGYSIPMVRRHGDRHRLMMYSDYELKTIQNAWNN